MGNRYRQRRRRENRRKHGRVVTERLRRKRRRDDDDVAAATAWGDRSAWCVFVRECTRRSARWTRRETSGNGEYSERRRHPRTVDCASGSTGLGRLVAPACGERRLQRRSVPWCGSAEAKAAIVPPGQRAERTSAEGEVPLFHRLARRGQGLRTVPAVESCGKRVRPLTHPREYSPQDTQATRPITVGTTCSAFIKRTRHRRRFRIAPKEQQAEVHRTASSRRAET